MKKIRLLCLMLAALLAAPFCLVSHGADVSDEKPEILRVGFFAFSGYHTVGDDGRRGGYGYEFLQRIAIRLDLRICRLRQIVLRGARNAEDGRDRHRNVRFKDRGARKVVSFLKPADRRQLHDHDR